MRKLILSIAILSLTHFVFGQQNPQFTQFMQTGNIFNPAMTGINRYTDFKIGYRKQWAGLPNSPTTLFATISGQFGHSEPTFSLPVRGRISDQFETSQKEAKISSKHSMGGYIIADRTSPTTLNIGNLSYAYHIPLNPKWSLSAGLGLSAMQTSLDRDKLNVRLQDDPGIGNGINSKVNPDLNGGLFLNSETFFVGYSANFLLRNKIYSLSDGNSLVGQQKVHHYGLIGFRLDLNENWYISPAAMMKYVDKAPISSDIYCRFGYKDVLWFGPSFRNQDSFSGFLGFNLSNFLSLSYSYDYNYSQLSTASSGSHEVVLGFRFVESGTKISRPSMW